MARSPTEAPGTTEPAEPRVKIALAWLASAWEAAWRAAWPVATVLGAFLVVAGFDLLPDLPGWLHALILIAFAAALVLASRPLWRLRLPDGLAARRRLERDSGIEHRPLTGLRDTQATGTADPLSRVLWQRHLAQRAAQLRLLKPRLPRPRNAEADRYALRGLVVIGLVLAVVAAGDDWRGRLGRAVSPGLFGAAAATAPRLDLFVTPPAYTGRPPIYLTAGQMAAPAAGQPAPGPVEIPTGSALVGRVAGGDEAPTLNLAGGDTAFTPIEGGNYELQAKITGGDRLSVSQDGTVLGDWAVKVLPDAPPTVSFTDKPKPTERQALRIDATAGDDYGIASLTATVTLAPGAPAVLDPAPLTITLSVPGRWPRELKTTSYQDLTPHAWAGQAVDMVLTATDAAGQSTKSAVERVALPEREFHHPVARAIIEQRRTLTLQPDQSETVAETLDMLSQRPDRYYDDKVVFLALRTAARRLFFAQDPKPHIAALRDLLWDTALRIEDGDMSLAERSLRDAQQRLADALERNASDEEIKQLSDELRRAMDRYLQAMSEQMRQKMERGELAETPLPPDAQIMDQKQFQDMIDKMQQLSESGAKDEARQLLSQMQNMMENLRMGQMSQEQAQASQRAMNLLKDLQKLTNAQRQLLDQTFRQQQAQQGGEEGDPSQQQPQDGTPEQNAQTQEALRRALGEMMRELGDMGGDIPMPLGRAERAMKQSGESLAQGDPSGSVPSQTEALDQLQQGLQGLAQQMMESMAMQPGMTGPGQPGRQSGTRDPLGRALDDRDGGQGTAESDNGTKVPTQFDTERARAILDELRQRLNGRSSSPQERDYIQRLLRQF
ncbi:TIGR02302 family protein [Inquilinus sp.]|uniref:TIGR02302 family protein n=1 Tax=Inquilinus sp. TaxID=1932117 RepID=UPI003782FB2C